jgi:hypothetical protein
LLGEQVARNIASSSSHIFFHVSILAIPAGIAGLARTIGDERGRYLRYDGGSGLRG